MGGCSVVVCEEAALKPSVRRSSLLSPVVFSESDLAPSTDLALGQVMFVHQML